jgi:hypothetical protein
MRVDPRPLRPDTSITHFEPSALASVSDDVIAARSRELDQLGFRRGVGDLPTRCPSVLLPTGPEVDRAGCPATQALVVSLSLSRTVHLESGEAVVAVRTTEMARERSDRGIYRHSARG